MLYGIQKRTLAHVMSDVDLRLGGVLELSLLVLADTDYSS